MALSENTPRSYETNVDPAFDHLPVAASTTIYEGAAVGDNASGYMQGLVSGYPFRGFAEAKADNSTGAAAAINVKVRRQGVIRLTVTGATAVTDVGKNVYATADGTFTLTPSGTLIGKVARWETSTTCLVLFVGEQQRVNADAVMIVDPGASGSINVTKSGVVPIVTATGEARTLPVPTFPGQWILLYLKTDGGDATITVTSGYDDLANTSIVLNDVGDSALFHAVESGSNLRWRLTKAQGAAGFENRLVAKTGDYTVTNDDKGKFFTTTGATAAVVFTLPAPAAGNAGHRIEFFNTVDQVMTVSGNAADKLITFNDLDADSVAFSTSGEKIGAHVIAVSNATAWLVTKTGGHTMTVAT